VNIPSIDKTQKSPISEQIRLSILNAILSGNLKHNSPLPYEEDVAEFYHVSRSVVRKAYEQLEEMGYITRIKRLGTRVKILPVFYVDIEHVIRFPHLITSDSNSVISLDPHMVLREPIKTNNLIEELKKTKQTWLRQATLYTHQLQPLVFCDAYLPAQIAHDDFTNLNIFQLKNQLIKQFKTSSMHITFDYRIVKANSFIATTLNLSTESVVYHFNLKLLNDQNHCHVLLQLFVDAASLHIIDQGHPHD
jgi:DNA-binding GntR family transcriptional regulator